jgi:hypothetical protein
MKFDTWGGDVGRPGPVPARGQSCVDICRYWTGGVGWASANSRAEVGVHSSMLYAMARFSCCRGSGSPRQVGTGLSSFDYAVLARGEKRLHKFPVAIGQQAFSMGWSLRPKEMNLLEEGADGSIVFVDCVPGRPACLKRRCHLLSGLGDF